MSTYFGPPKRPSTGFLISVLCSGIILALIFTVLALFVKNVLMLLLGLLIGFSAIIAGSALSFRPVRSSLAQEVIQSRLNAEWDKIDWDKVQRKMTHKHHGKTPRNGGEFPKNLNSLKNERKAPKSNYDKQSRPTTNEQGEQLG